MPAQHYCLRWKNHHSNVQTMFTQLLEKDRFCDVRILCGGVTLRAHRAVLASCSALLRSLLTGRDDPPDQTEAVLVVDGAEPQDVAALLRYMYTGEISVHHSQLTSLLKTAEELRIKGLADIRWAGSPTVQDPSDTPASHHYQIPDETIAPKLNETDAKSNSIGCTVEEDKTSKPEENSSKSQQLSSIDKDSKSEKLDVHGVDENTVSDAAVKPQAKDERTLVIPSSCSVMNGGPPPLRWITEKTKTSTVSCQTEDNRKRNIQDAAGNVTPDSESHSSPKQIKTETPHLIQKLVSDIKWNNTPPKYVGTIKKEPDIEKCEDSAALEESDEEDYDGSAHDISQFLDTSLREGDDDMSDGCELIPTSHNRLSPVAGQSIPLTPVPITSLMPSAGKLNNNNNNNANSGNSDPRFRDVVKLNDYLRNGRRPQFWEEEYVLRVMEAVRSKDLEMKQAAEILGVSYGTLYGRYRDVYGCINRPYSIYVDNSRSRDFWTEQGGSEILLRLRQGEVPLSAAAEALGVAPPVLAAYVSKLGGGDSGTGNAATPPEEADPPPAHARSVSPSAGQSTDGRRGRPPRILAPATLNANYAAIVATTASAMHNNTYKRLGSPEDPDAPLVIDTSASVSPSFPASRPRGRPPKSQSSPVGITSYRPIAPALSHASMLKTLHRNVAHEGKQLTTYDSKPCRIPPDLDNSVSPPKDHNAGDVVTTADVNASILRSRPELTIIAPVKKDTAANTT